MINLQDILWVCPCCPYEENAFLKSHCPWCYEDMIAVCGTCKERRDKKTGQCSSDCTTPQSKPKAVHENDKPPRRLMKRARSWLLFCMLASSLLFPCNKSHHCKTENINIKLYILEGGDSQIEDKSIFHPSYSDEENFTIPTPSFLIVHPEGTLIWDCGMPGEETAIIHQLQELNLQPEEVDYLAFSHWHYDHTGTSNIYTKSMLLSQSDEYEYAFSDQASEGFGMKPNTYCDLKANPKNLFMGDHDVFGDGLVTIRRVGGHTVGSQILEIKLSNSTIILSGDICHFREQLEHRRVPDFHYSYDETIDIMNHFDNWTKESDRHKLWITHDPNEMNLLQYSPTFYY